MKKKESKDSLENYKILNEIKTVLGRCKVENFEKDYNLPQEYKRKISSILF